MLHFWFLTELYLEVDVQPTLELGPLVFYPSTWEGRSITGSTNGLSENQFCLKIQRINLVWVKIGRVNTDMGHVSDLLSRHQLHHSWPWRSWRGGGAEVSHHGGWAVYISTFIETDQRVAKFLLHIFVSRWARMGRQVKILMIGGSVTRTAQCGRTGTTRFGSTTTRRGHHHFETLLDCAIYIISGWPGASGRHEKPCQREAITGKDLHHQPIMIISSQSWSWLGAVGRNEKPCQREADTGKDLHHWQLCTRPASSGDHHGFENNITTVPQNHSTTVKIDIVIRWLSRSC